MSHAIIVIATPSELANLDNALATYIKGNFPQEAIQSALATIKAIYGDTPEYRKTAEAVTAKPKTDWAKYINEKCETVKNAPIDYLGLKGAAKALADLAGEVPCTQEQAKHIQSSYGIFLHNVANKARHLARGTGDIDRLARGDLSEVAATLRDLFTHPEYMESMNIVAADATLRNLLEQAERKLSAEDKMWLGAAFASLAQ